VNCKIDGFVKSPSAALRFTFVAAAYIASTPHSSGFARLASGAFYAAITWATFYEIIKIDGFVKNHERGHCEQSEAISPFVTH
jgi:hypothetical protein